jgi:hypothetical protein
MPQAAALVTHLLLLAVAFDGWRVLFSVLPLIVGMGVTPLFAAFPYDLSVERIGTNLGPVIIAAAALLAGTLAANDLLRMIVDRLKNLLAVRATAITHQVAPEQNVIASFCSEPLTNLHRRQKIAAYRNCYRVFTASPPMGLLLIKPAKMMLFFTGADRKSILIERTNRPPRQRWTPPPCPQCQEKNGRAFSVHMDSANPCSGIGGVPVHFGLDLILANWLWDSGVPH